jgi:GxxExxY protein
VTMNLIDQIKASLETEATDQRTFETAKWKGILYPELSWQIVGAAIEVHKHIGPGQVESVYQCSMECELRRRAIATRSQVPVPMFFKGERVGDFYADLIVEDTIILELKAVERFQAVHTAQLVSYLRATGLRLGLLMNFNVPRMVHGVKRVIR